MAWARWVGTRCRGPNRDWALRGEDNGPVHRVHVGVVVVVVIVVDVVSVVVVIVGVVVLVAVEVCV